MLMEMAGIFLGLFLMIVFTGGGFQTVYLLDLPSLVIILAFVAPTLLRGSVWRDFVRAFRMLRRAFSCHLGELRRSLDVIEMLQKQILCAGVMATLVGLISMLHRLSEPASIGPNLAVAILTMLYAVILEMALLPLQLEVKRRIIDYMEVDTDDINEERGDEAPARGDRA